MTDRRASGDLRSLGPTALLVALAVALVASVRARLFNWERRVKEVSDVYVLPPPEDVVTLSLGYRAALADVLWAQVLVSQGLHMLEKRRYENLILLMDTINELDPRFREPYLFADALITFQQNETPVEEVRKARAIMERGARARPLDAELHVTLGQFMAFVAPSTYLTDPEEQKEWRLEGARYLERAAELGGENSATTWQALGGAGVLFRAGELEGSIRFLQRARAVTEDDELRAKIDRQLEGLYKRFDKARGEQLAEAYRARDRGFQELWRKDLVFVSKGMMLTLGPRPEPAYCAGGAHADDARCASTWREWARRKNRELGLPER